MSGYGNKKVIKEKKTIDLSSEDCVRHITKTFKDKQNNNMYNIMSNSEQTVKNGKFLTYKTYFKVCKDPAVRPLSECIRNCVMGEEGSFVIQDKKKPNHRQYVNIPYTELPNIWDTDYCLSEVIHTKTPVKMFFDLDIYEKDEDRQFYNEEYICGQLVKYINMIDLKQDDVKVEDIAISKSRAYCDKNRAIKLSYHIVFNNQKMFLNIVDYKRFTTELKQTIYENGGSVLIDMIDWCMGKENQVFKLPYQSKSGCSNVERIQKPIGEKKEVYDFVVSGGYLEAIGSDADCIVDMYSVVECENKMKVASLTTHKTNKKLQVSNFNLQSILLTYKNDVEYNEKDIYKTLIEPRLAECPYGTIEYYLNSIPNNCYVSYDMYLLIGMICKRCSNSDENDLRGFELWCEWTSRYGAINESQMKYQYGSFSPDRGYGFKTLMTIASIFNPMIGKKSKLIEPLFSFDTDKDWDTIKVNTDKLGTKVDVMDIVSKYDTVFIKAPMASGKSYMLRTLYELEPDASVLLLSCKRSFASAMVSEFKQYGFENYMSIEMKSDMVNYDRVICSVESLRYCRDSYDYVIIDESESIAVNIIGGMNMKNNPYDNILKFYNVLNNSSKMFVMDAYLCNRSKNLVKDILKTHRKTVYILNEYKPPKRFIKKTNEEQLVKSLNTNMGKGKECVFVSNSLKKQKNVCLHLDCNDTDVITYNKLHRLDNSIDVEKEWKGVKLLSYTPTITAGINYSSEPKDFLYLYLLNKGSCLLRDSIQASKRVRNFRSPIIEYLMFNMPCEGEVPLTLEEVKQSQMNYIESIEKSFDSFTSCEGDERLRYIVNLVIFCALEENLNECCFKALFERFMECENIEIKSDNCSKKMLESMWSEDKEFDYKVCPLITDEEYEALEVKKQDEGILANEWEYEKYMKYKYVNQFSDRTLDYERYESQFNQLGEAKNMKNMFNNIKFKNFANEVLNVDDDIFELSCLVLKEPLQVSSVEEEIQRQVEKQTKSNEKSELIEKYLLKYSYILQYLNKLGFIKTIGTNHRYIDWEHTYLTSDYSECRDIFEDVGYRTLTQLFEDKNLRLKNVVNDKCKDLSTREMHSVLNNMLKEELGIMSFSQGRKKIKGKENQIYKLVCEENTQDDTMFFQKYMRDIQCMKEGGIGNIAYNNQYEVPLEPVQKEEVKVEEPKVVKKKFKIKKFIIKKKNNSK